MAIASQLLLWGIVFHLIVDWFFQNHWMATYKASLLHPASWAHAGIHFIAMTGLFRPEIALVIAILHLLIDTRRPLKWWRKVYRQTVDGDIALHVAIWEDQVAHITVIAFAALLTGVLR